MLTVYTGGTYDIPHLGHYNFFKQCKELFPESYLWVALNSDEFVEEYKGTKPLFNYSERYKFISNVSYVDFVVKNIDGADSKPTILRLNPNVIVIGNDWLEKDYCKQMGFDAKWLRDNHISLCYLPYTEGISTSEIKRRINAG